MVRHISDRVAVMYLGVLVELASRDEIRIPRRCIPTPRRCSRPCPSRIRSADEKRKRTILVGDVPSPVNPPSGCRFRTRCPIAVPMCAESRPELRELKPDHFVACHFCDNNVYNSRR